MDNSRPVGWDAQRGAERWRQLPPEQQALNLAELDRLLMASQGLQLLPDGTARRRQVWKVVGKK